MRPGTDIAREFPGIFVIHQKIRGNRIDSHHHADDHEFFIPLQGDIRIRLVESGEECAAGPGRMIYLPPGAAHSFEASPSAQGERLIFLVRDSAWRANSGGKFGARSFPASQLAKELLFHLLLHPDSKGISAFVSTLVFTLSEMLAEEIPGGDSVHRSGRVGDSRIARALAELRKQAYSPVKMAQVAKASGVSLRNLNRLFLVETGMSPKQFVTRLRIERAQKLLRGGRRTVTDVSLEVGYGSVSQFIAAFRALTGQLPSRYGERG